MTTYSVMLTVDASFTVEVEADSLAQALEVAMEEASCPTICHHCSHSLQLGEILEAVEAIEQ